ncbi:MAG: hypothetical protein ACPGVB_11275, partial [Chitinophagales bacterium]
MNQQVLKVSLRNKAIFVPTTSQTTVFEGINKNTAVLLANAKKLGFTFSEELLEALNTSSLTFQAVILETLKKTTGVDKNWTPLVKGWDIPTGESITDHLLTFFANAFDSKEGTTLPCGHLIPENTFPLERYNGCPFCGTPFVFGEIEVMGQGSKLKVLELWKDEDLQQYFEDLLTSKTALDVTQMDSLKLLLSELPFPNQVKIVMKETAMVVIDGLVAQEKNEDASALFKNPNDILRYLWYKKTGFLQIIQPDVIVQRIAKNHRNRSLTAEQLKDTQKKAKEKLKLKYSRKECRRVAKWLNVLKIDVQTACEIMHPKRSMWIRFIRALRLVEYSKKKGFENLADLLTTFHQEKYTVWAGRVQHFRLKKNAEETFALLQQRPGLFARSLFANMLWFGSTETLTAFRKITDKIPARLLLTLNMYASYYFNPKATRSVKPLGNTSKTIPSNPMLKAYSSAELKKMILDIEDLCVEVIQKRFLGVENENQSMYIAEKLFDIPLSIGDRSENIQDLPSALMGTKFPVEGKKVRLFMQWGNGLTAQHLDMDLSCHVAYADKTDFCSYSQLKIEGCKHSGDIITIPEKVGTAEYIEVNVKKLAKAKAKYVSFTCNAYSNGSITPDLVVGWMNSKFPMKISEKTGVAYDPSCVQHQIRITQGLTKGLVFGVLDVEAKEITWLEMSYDGQVVQNMDIGDVEALLAKLDTKLTIGNLLKMKAEAQGLTIVESPEQADERYDLKWA